MPLWSQWSRRKRQFEQQMSEELRFHIEKQIAANISTGMTSKEARRQARLQLGAIEGLKANCREQRRGFWLETLGADVRYGLRVLRKSPGFTVVAVLTLALGIGSNTAIFSIVDAVFLRPLPYPHADQIFVVHRTGNQFGGISISVPVYLAWKPQASIFEHLALVHWRLDASLTGTGESERIPSAQISAEFLPTIGAEPAMGRNFRPDEGRLGGANAVLISNDLWRNRFGSDPNALGREITLDGEGYTIVGILPRGLDVPLPSIHGAQIFFPLRVPVASQDPSNSGMLAIGLLKRGVTPEEAAARLTPALWHLRVEFPKMFGAGEKVQLTPLRDILREWAGPAPLLLFGAVGLVLLIACANVANLSLSRSTVRQHEMAIRVAIGAGRLRIARQLLTESVLLSLLGGILGVVACYASFHLIVGLVPTDVTMPHVGAYQIDATVLGFALLLSVATGVIFGFAPALSASRLDLNASLQEAGPRTGAGQHGGLRQTLAISEIAISVVLLIGAALALESFASLVRVQPGFDANNVTTAQFSLSEKQYDTPAKRSSFIREAVNRLAALPGVESTSMIDTIPLREGSDTLINIEGRPDNPREVLGAEIRAISPRFFDTLRIPLVRGRTFSDADNENSQPVVIIDRAMARAYWPKGDAMGAHIWIGRALGPKFAEPAAREVVGIVGGAREVSLAEAPWPTMYIPANQMRQGVGWGYFLIRSERAGAISAAAVRGTLLKLDPANPPSEIIPLEQTVSTSLTDWRFRAVLLGAFAGLAFFIAIIGVYGVISYWVAQRRHEIGVRVALGAEARDVLQLVLGHGARLTLAGLAIGIAATLALTRVLASLLYGVQYGQPPMLYGVRATDPLTISGVALLLAAVALLACYIPARRAMRVDPVVALRHV
jgi:putative ABC transport system permease protein